MMHLADGHAAAGTATSSFSTAVYSPGAGVRVSIVVMPDSAITVYAIEDQPPTGWTVSAIDNSGGFDSNNRKVKWGPFFDNLTRTLSYTATPPAGESGPKSFAGVASFDGVSAPIVGARTLPAVAFPDLSIVKSHTGNFAVGVNGTYLIAVSNVGSSTASGTVTVTDPLPTGLSYISGSGINWACSASGQMVTCGNSNSLAPGASSTITLTVGVDAAAAPGVTNTAAVTFVGDSNGSNNSSSDPTSVSTGPQTLTYMTPNSIVAGSPEFLLTVNGTNFHSNSIVLWNGMERTTYPSGTTRLRALIYAADVANAGTAGVSVRDSTPGATVTNSLPFTVLKILTAVSVPFTKADYASTGGNAILSARVGGVPFDAGNVTFQIWDGSASVGSPVTSGTLINRTASVSYPLPKGLRPSNYGIEATFSGASNYASSQGFGTLKVYASDSNLLTLKLLPDGGDMRISAGAAKLLAGYSILDSTLTSNPVALANFGYSPVTGAGPVLITEAGMPSSSAMTAARMFVECSSTTDTGIALVNTDENRGLTLKAEFRNGGGKTVASIPIEIAPRSHKAVFAGQLVPDLPRPFLGTLTLTGDGNSNPGSFAAVTLGAMTNGRGEILYSSLPLTDPGAAPADANLIFPQIVDGGGTSSQVYLMNPSGNGPSVGKIAFYDNDGKPLTLGFLESGGAGSQLEFSLAPDGMMQIVTRGLGAVQVGYAVVTVTSGKLPIGSASFLFRQGPVVVSHAAVPAAIQTTSARTFVEVASTPLYRNTGIALVNPGLSTAVLALKLTGTDGKSITTTLTLPAGAHIAKFLDELFPGRVPTEFRGVLDVSSSTPIAPLLLRLSTNQRGESIYSTLPVANLLNPPKGQQYLPQIVDGEGYQTQIIVINTTADTGTVYAELLDALGKSLQVGFR
jgi:uncharacterized repeat protein (TIGR01451 family)